MSADTSILDQIISPELSHLDKFHPQKRLIPY